MHQVILFSQQHLIVLQTTRQKAAIEEDLSRSQEDNVRLNDFNGKLAKEKEELAKEKANLIVQLTATERENRSLSEEIAGLRFVSLLLNLESLNFFYISKSILYIFYVSGSFSIENLTLKSKFFINQRSDKEALETNLFDSQSNNTTLLAKKEQLEEVNQNALLKNEALQGKFFYY